MRDKSLLRYPWIPSGVFLSALRLAGVPALLVSLSVSSAYAQYQVGASKHLGFDQYAVGTATQMQILWNDSPYFDVAFYPNGAVNH